MTPRLVMYLGLAALVSAGAAGAMWRAEHAVPATAQAGDRLLPGLVDDVNVVAGMVVGEADRSIELRKTKAGWTVEPSGYPVEAKKLQTALVGLVRMTKLEPRTAVAGKYSVIEVEDPGSADSKSRRISLENDAGKVIGDVILGKTAQGFTSGNDEAQYVRLSGDSQSWLVKGSVSAGGELKDWVDTTVMKINAGDVKQVEFRSGDSEPMVIVKAGKDSKGNDRFEIQNLPAGIQPKDEVTVRYAATDLANVGFTNVRAAKPGSVEANKVLLETDTGLKVAYSVIEEGEQTWLKVAVAEKGSNAEDAEKIAKQVAGWEFQLAGYKAKQFKMQLAEVLSKVQ